MNDSNLCNEGGKDIERRHGGKDGVFATAWHRRYVSTRLLLEHESDPHRLKSVNDQVRKHQIGIEERRLEQAKVRTVTLVKSNYVAKKS